MKRHAAIAAALVAAALALAAPAAFAGEKEALGVWDVVASTPDGPLPSVMTVKKVEGKVKAEIELGGLKRAVSDESLAGDVLKLKVDYEGALYSIQATVAGDTLAGTWEGNGNSGDLRAKRRP